MRKEFQLLSNKVGMIRNICSDTLPPHNHYVQFNFSIKATRNFKCHSSKNLHKNSFATKIKPSSLGNLKACVS